MAHGNTTDFSFRGDLLPTIPEIDRLDNVKTVARDRHESPTADKSILAELVAGTKENHYQEVESSALPPTKLSSSESTRDVIKPVVEDPVTDKRPGHSNIQGPSPSLHSQTEGEDAFAKQESEIGKKVSPELIITAPLPPVDSSSHFSTTKPLEDLPSLPLDESSSRPSTPKFVVDPPTETTPKFPHSRSNKRVDVEHLRLPSSTLRDLPLLSPDPATGNKYPGGVSLQLGLDTSPLNDTNASQTTDDPEDEDPGMSSFGDGTIQAIPVAQVGLRSPMFPGTSRSKNVLGATDSPTQRFFPQISGPVDIDEFDESAYDPKATEKDNRRRSLPSIGVDAPAEDGGEKGEEGRSPLSWIARQFKS